MANKKKKILGIVCERSVDLKKHLNGSKLKEKDNVVVVEMICSGMIQPIMIEEGFKQGASVPFQVRIPRMRCLSW